MESMVNPEPSHQSQHRRVRRSQEEARRRVPHHRAPPDGRRHRGPHKLPRARHPRPVLGQPAGAPLRGGDGERPAGRQPVGGDPRGRPPLQPGGLRHPFDAAREPARRDGHLPHPPAARPPSPPWDARSRSSTRPRAPSTRTTRWSTSTTAWSRRAIRPSACTGRSDRTGSRSCRTTGSSPWAHPSSRPSSTCSTSSGPAS